MSGQAHWITLLPFFLGAIGLWFLIWREAREDRQYQLEERRYLCPDQRVKVNATLVRDAGSDAVIGVRRCSGSPDPETLACGRGCVDGFAPRVSRLSTKRAS